MIMNSHRLTDVKRIWTFVHGGNARFTLVSMKTGVRFTYQVRKSEDADVRFVRVLTGPDNEKGYTFLGTIKPAGQYTYYEHGYRSSIDRSSQSAMAFRYFFNRIRAGDLKDLEFWHEGRCGRCGRTLTVPESIETGFGPECASILGPASSSESAPVVAAAIFGSNYVDEWEIPR